MVKYIEAEKAIKILRNLSHEEDADDAEILIRRMPAADVQEVRNGRWEPYLNEGLIVKCSVCGSRYTVPWNFCPNCGASMGRGGRMITIDLRATYDGMKVSDKEFMDCIKAMKDMGFTDESIQKKLDKAKMDEVKDEQVQDRHR